MFNWSAGARWTLAAGLTIAVAMGISRFAYTPLLPDMRGSFQWTLTQVGDLGSMNYLGYLLGAMAAPGFVARGSIRIPLGMALLGCVLTTWLGAFTSDYLQWCAIRLGSGVASAFCLVLVTAQLGALLNEQQRSRFGNLHFSGVGLGIMASVVMIGSEPATDAAAVARRWELLAAFSAALLLPAWALFRSVPLPAPAAQSSNAAGALGPALWRVILGYGGFGFGYVITATFIVAMAQQTTGGSGAKQIWLVTGMAAVPSVWLWQRLGARWGLAATLGFAYLVEAGGVLIAALGTQHWQLLLGGALLGGTFAAITALGLSLAQQLAPAQAARAVGVMTAAFALGQLLGPGVAGRLAALGDGFVLPSAVAAALLVAAAALLWRLPQDSAPAR